MPEFRQNVANGEWVIIAPERARRPEDFQKPSIREEELPAHDKNCPFCTGNEHMCKAPLLEKKNDQGGWDLRVVPNIYAAVNTSVPADRVRNGMFLSAGGYGVADVLIESPLHNTCMATMPEKHLMNVIEAYKIRYNEIVRDHNINTVNIFRNHGASAGASLVHPHSQIIGTLVAPPHIGDQIHYARRAYNTYGSCVYCDLIQAEQEEGIRVVESSEHFLALCPYASKSPYEIRIYPRRHSAVFGSITETEEKDLAQILRSCLAKIYNLLGNPDYNYYIRSISAKDGEADHYHWYVVIIPRITQYAGFELGTGIYINSTSPETCAEDLRLAKSVVE